MRQTRTVLHASLDYPAIEEARTVHGDHDAAKHLRITRFGNSRPASWAAIRPATAVDAPRLSALALRSKAYWLYDDQFLEARRDELTVRPEDIERYRVTVLDYEGQALGFFGIEGQAPDGELWWFFLDPIVIGSGGGRVLWDHMASMARALGMRNLRIEADPNAEAFYLRMGARRVGEVRSLSIRERFLPLLTYELD